MNTRWARHGLSAAEAGTIVLSACDAMSVTRRRSFARASSVLRRCVGAVSCDVRVERGSVKFSWPKWPIFQAFASRELPENHPWIAPSASASASSPSREKNQKKKESPDKPATHTPEAWALALSESLIEHVRTAPGGRIPPRARATWAQEISRMPREIQELSNGSAEDHIRSAIEWAFGAENTGQYAIVIRSGRALREKWPQLVAAAQRARRQPPNPMTQNEVTKRELLRRRQAEGIRLPGDPPLPGREEHEVRDVPGLVPRVVGDGR